LLIALAVIVVSVGLGIFVFRERPLIPKGYTIAYSGGSSHTNGSRPNEYLTLYTWEAGSSLIEYNPEYPEYRGSQYLTIDTDELEAILKTAKYRVTSGSFNSYFSGDLKYLLVVVLNNGAKNRHLNIYLGKRNVVSIGTGNYEIQNAEDLIRAIDSAKSIEIVYNSVN
jgi:hypothetical protein